jgi:hypothetical protein
MRHSRTRPTLDLAYGERRALLADPWLDSPRPPAAADAVDVKLVMPGIERGAHVWVTGSRVASEHAGHADISEQIDGKAGRSTAFAPQRRFHQHDAAPKPVRVGS